MPPPHATADVNRPKGRSLKPLRALVPFIRPYSGVLLLAMISLLLASSAILVMPVAVRYVIDFGFTAEDAANIDRYFIYLFGVVLLMGLFVGITFFRALCPTTSARSCSGSAPGIRIVIPPSLQ